MICKLCGEDRKLVDAHIIPRSLYPLDHDRSGIRILSSREGLPRRSQTGEYDSGLVCAPCEKRFDPWDDYAPRLLTAEVTNRVSGDDGEALAYILTEVDYPRIKLFFLSLLWRMGATTRPMFQHVKLGPHERTLARMILAGDPGGVDDFTVVLRRFIDPIGAKAMLDPHPQRVEGLRTYRLYVPGYTVAMKVDSRPASGVLKDFALKPGEPWIVLLADFTKSTEMRVVNKVMHQYRLREKAKPKRNR